MERRPTSTPTRARSEVGAVSADGDDVTFATTGGTRKHPTADLWRISGTDDPVKLANLFRYEKRHNPDADNHYGIGKIGPSCAKKLPRGAAPYSGIVESHPYATALDGGITYVADAAGNSILKVNAAGRVSTVAALPATKVKITRKIKRKLGLPACVVGKVLRLEPVPTDVEMGPDGNLYVTSLPGGPEDPSLGANGRIYKVQPSSGAVQKETGGLVEPGRPGDLAHG